MKLLDITFCLEGNQSRKNNVKSVNKLHKKQT